MSLTRQLIMIGIALTLSSCFMYEKAIVMTDPKTQQTIVCRRGGFDTLKAADRCAEALEQAGWKRAGTSP